MYASKQEAGTYGEHEKGEEYPWARVAEVSLVIRIGQEAATIHGCAHCWLSRFGLCGSEESSVPWLEVKLICSDLACPDESDTNTYGRKFCCFILG